MPTAVSDHRGVATAILARAQQFKDAGGDQTGAYPLTGGMSPLVQSYNEWNFGGRSYGKPMPRSFDEFVAGAFGPMAPIQPIGIDKPQPDGRPEPRRWQYPVGWNMPIGTPGTEGLKLASFATLRYLADAASLVRACIDVRCDEVLGLDWDITPTVDAAQAMKTDVKATEDFQKRRREMLQFWKRPDPQYASFRSWLAAVLEELFVVDAISLYVHPPRLDGKGVLGSNLASLDLLDGSTIRPLLDLRGGTPSPPNVAYQAYEWGVPRVDLAQVMLEDDIDGLAGSITASMIDQYAGDQLLYLPHLKRTWTPYGFSCVERALMPATTQLRKQMFRLEFFTEGSIPGMFVIAGEGYTQPEQIRQLQDALNALAGDTGFKHKIIVLPAGSSADPQKPISLAGADDEVMMVEVCMAFGVQPMQLGIAPKVSTSQSSGSSNQMAALTDEKADARTIRLCGWLKDEVLDLAMQGLCKQHDMQWTWEGMDRGEDELTKVQRQKIQIGTGTRTIDEVRAENGDDAYGDPLTSVPVWATATGLQPLNVGGAEAKSDIQDAQHPEPPPGEEPGFGEPGKPGDDGPGGGKPSGQGGGTTSDRAQAEPEEIQQGEKRPTAKMLAEVETLRRYLKKGRALADFTPQSLPASLLDKISPLADADYMTAIRAARRVIKAESQQDDRRRHLEEALAATAVALYRLSLRTRAAVPDLGMADFLDQATIELRNGIASAVKMASRRAAGAHGAAELSDEAVRKIVQARIEAQLPYLQGLARDIQAGLWREGADRAATGEELMELMRPRFDLYAAQLKGAYQQSYADTMWDAFPESECVWTAVGPNPCDLCADRDGVLYTRESLPGYPGDGDFGGPVCEGGPQCWCELVWTKGRDESRSLTDRIQDEFAAGNALEMAATADLTKDTPADWRAREHYRSADDPARSCATCAAFDAGRCLMFDGALVSPAATCDDWIAPAGTTAAGVAVVAADSGRVLMLQRALDDDDRAAGKWEFPGGRLEDGETPLEGARREWEEEVGQPLPDGQIVGGWVSGVYECFVYLIPAEADVDLNLNHEDRDVINPDDPDGDRIEVVAWWDPADAIGAEAMRDEVRAGADWPQVMVATTVNRSLARRQVQKALAPNADLAEIVYRSLAKEFAADTLEWVRKASWTFEAAVPVATVITTEPRTHLDLDRVQEFLGRLGGAGKPPKPLILVETSNGLELADGHHKTFAAQDAGVVSLPGFVGRGVGDTGPWQGAMHANKLAKRPFEDIDEQDPRWRAEDLGEPMDETDIVYYKFALDTRDRKVVFWPVDRLGNPHHPDESKDWEVEGHVYLDGGYYFHENRPHELKPKKRAKAIARARPIVEAYIQDVLGKQPVEQPDRDEPDGSKEPA